MKKVENKVPAVSRYFASSIYLPKAHTFVRVFVGRLLYLLSEIFRQRIETSFNPSAGGNKGIFMHFRQATKTSRFVVSENPDLAF